MTRRVETPVQWQQIQQAIDSEPSCLHLQSLQDGTELLVESPAFDAYRLRPADGIAAMQSDEYIGSKGVKEFTHSTRTMKQRGRQAIDPSMVPGFWRVQYIADAVLDELQYPEQANARLYLDYLWDRFRLVNVRHGREAVDFLLPSVLGRIGLRARVDRGKDEVILPVNYDLFVFPTSGKVFKTYYAPDGSIDRRVASNSPKHRARAQRLYGVLAANRHMFDSIGAAD